MPKQKIFTICALVLLLAMSIGLIFHIVSTQNYNYTPVQDNASTLPVLGTPYVGAAHETSRIVGLLPLPGDNFTLTGIEIGKDHAQTGYGDYTLTVLYSYQDTIRRLTETYEAAFESNAAFLFEHIGNLQAVTFAVNHNLLNGDEPDESGFAYQWSRVRSDTEINFRHCGPDPQSHLVDVS